MLKFRGRTIRVKVKVDSLDLLLIENLLKVDSKMQRATLGLKLLFYTTTDIEHLTLTVRDLYLKQWYPKDPQLYAPNLPTSFMSFLSSDNQTQDSFQTDILLDIGQLEFSRKSTIVNDDNSFVKTLSQDYWKGDFNRTRISIWTVLFPDLVDCGESGLVGYKTLESLKVILTDEDERIKKEFDVI